MDSYTILNYLLSQHFFIINTICHHFSVVFVVIIVISQ
jgi:hypothetical protein